MNKSIHKLADINPDSQQKTIKKRYKGFTLIEMVIGITLLGLSVLILTSTVFPYFDRSVKQQQEVKAASLAQSVMNVIIGYSFDEKSDHAGDITRCDERNSSGTLIRCNGYMGSEEAEVYEFDDVDDFYGCWWVNEDQRQQCLNSGAYPESSRNPDFEGNGDWLRPLDELLGNEIAQQYKGFRVYVRIYPYPDTSNVEYDPNNRRALKMIYVEVAILDETEPRVRLVALKGNY